MIQPMTDCSISVASVAPPSVLQDLLNDVRETNRLNEIAGVASASIACLGRGPGAAADAKAACVTTAARFLAKVDQPAWWLVMDVAREDTRIARHFGLWKSFLKEHPIDGTLGPEVITTLDGDIQYSGLIRLRPSDFEHALRHQFRQMVRYQFFGPVFLGQLGSDPDLATERLRSIASPSGHGYDAIGMLMEVVRIGGLLAHAAGQPDEPRQEVHVLGAQEVITRLPLDPRAATE
jgi:hypothetical protein